MNYTKKLKRIFKLLRGIINFFRFKDEDEALVAGFAGTEEYIGMYEAVEILKRDRERMAKRYHHRK